MRISDGYNNNNDHNVLYIFEKYAQMICHIHTRVIVCVFVSFTCQQFTHEQISNLFFFFFQVSLKVMFLDALVFIVLRAHIDKLASRRRRAERNWDFPNSCAEFQTSDMFSVVVVVVATPKIKPSRALLLF